MHKVTAWIYLRFLREHTKYGIRMGGHKNFLEERKIRFSTLQRSRDNEKLERENYIKYLRYFPQH